MIEHSASPAPPRRQSPDIEKMRAAAAELLAPDAPGPRFDELDEWADRLRGHLQVLTSAVDDLARTKPVESVSREVALAEVESTHVLLTIDPEPGTRGAVRHLKHLARELLALCDHLEVLTGARPLGAA